MYMGNNSKNLYLNALSDIHSSMRAKKNNSAFIKRLNRRIFHEVADESK